MKKPSKDESQEDLPYGTRHQLDVFVCLSALQKFIRRGMEKEAMEFACELLNTGGKQYCTNVTKRLEIVSHEDIDTQTQPHIVPFVRAACEQAREWYDEKKLGHTRMAVGNAIRLMCRARKSREGDHFQAAIGLANIRGVSPPNVPDWAYDKHTKVGRMRGRGVAHFRSDGAKLVPEPDKDQYEDEAYRLWTIEEREEHESKSRARRERLSLHED